MQGNPATAENQRLVAPDCFACASRGGVQCGSSHFATDPLGRTRWWRRGLLGLLFKSQTVVQMISTRCLRKRRCRKASHQNDHERMNSHSFLPTIFAAPRTQGRTGRVSLAQKKKRAGWPLLRNGGARGTAIGRRSQVMSIMSNRGARCRNPALLIRQSYKGSFLGTDHVHLISLYSWKYGRENETNPLDDARPHPSARVDF